MGSGILVLNQPGVYLVDADGNAVTLDDGATIGTAEAILIAGKDGTVARVLHLNATGDLAALPLPAGAATEVTLAAVATETKLEAVRALLATIDTDTSNLDVALSTLATEAKLEAVRVLLASLDGKDYATQTTLATRAAAAQLPGALVGGRLDQNLGAWLGSTAPTVGQKVMASSVPITLASDQPAIPITTGAPAPSDSVRNFCRNGGSRDMNVDGSSTPVEFVFDADPTDDIAVTEVRLVMVAAAINMKGDDFGSDIPLTNGLKLEATSDGTTTEFANFLVNEDFLAAPGDILTVYDGPANDQVIASFNFGGALILKGGTADEIKVTVRDDLTNGGAHKCVVLWCVVFGRKL